jgi:hypothetical protein
MLSISAPSLISPTGTITSATPVYQWGAVTGAASYRLRIYDQTVGLDKIHDTWYTPAQAGCSGGGTCSITPAGLTLQNGHFKWYVAAKTADGLTSADSSLEFTKAVDAVAPSSVLLEVDKSSPRMLTGLGDVTFTATASGGTGTYEYRFELKDPITGLWSVAQNYGDPAGNSWTWTPSATGSYRVAVYARNAGSRGTYQIPDQATAAMYYDIVSILPVDSVDLQSDKASPQDLATAGEIKFTASATGGVYPVEYQFWFKKSTDPLWTKVQDYGNPAGAEWRWTPNAAGTYRILVFARSSGSSARSEATFIMDFVINP